MKNLKNSVFYVTTIGCLGALMYWIFAQGKRLEDGRHVVTPSAKDQWHQFLESMEHNLSHPLALLLCQVITIILVARIFGWFFRKIGQPTVIGEMLAGIVLGPSLVGMYFPEFSNALFPKESLGNLQFLSQIGLIFFMFVVGMELDLKALKNKANDAVVISHASIIFPFTLGVGLAYFIYEAYAPESVEFLSFALFLGIAMSITAFPVLARIVQERNIHKTRLGAIVITCAAADDITAWCILATVIAIVKAGSIVSSLYVIAMAFVYVVLMIKVVRPFLDRVAELKNSRSSLSKPVVAIFLLTLIISSYVSEIIGIHALFGAFMAGSIMPDNSRFRSIIIEKVEDVSVILLLPLFFVLTGLRTEIGMLNQIDLWEITGWIILVAVVGKFIGSAVAAKFVGQNWKDSLTIGALMNTRGLMQLIVLDIGYDLGVLSAEIFTMMVIMAIVTTFMTSPALDIINFAFRGKRSVNPEQAAANGYNILISFGNPRRGKVLLKLANAILGSKNDESVTALHMTLSNELHTFDLEEQERRIFSPILAEAEQIDQKVSTMFKASNDIDSDIVEIANKGEYDLLLVGLGHSIFEGSLLGKLLGFTTRIINPDRLIDKFIGKEGLFENSPFGERMRQVTTRTRMPVGILVDKDLDRIQRIFMPMFSAEDDFLAGFARQFVSNSECELTILGHLDENGSAVEAPQSNLLHQNYSGKVRISSNRTMTKEFLEQHDLMLVSLDSWKKLVDSESVWLSNVPSVLIIKP